MASDTGTLRIAQPNTRKFPITTMLPKRAIVITWIIKSTGYG